MEKKIMVTDHTLAVWDSFKYSAGLLSLHLPLLPLFNCPLFPLELETPPNIWWRLNIFTNVCSSNHMAIQSF